MKKYFSLASALMLALSMGMTSCSNDIDEVVTEKQPEMHKLYLSATAPNSTETRAYVEGSDDSDAITITGWKAGDKLYGIYMKNPQPASGGLEGEPGMVEFEFNGSTKEFESEPTSVTNDQIKYFLHGNNPTVDVENYNPEFNYISGDLELDAIFLFSGFEMVNLDTHSTDIPMWGEASVVGDKLAANMQLLPNMALVCVHNESGSSIEVSMDMVLGGNTYPMKGLGLQVTTGNPLNFMTNDIGDAALTTTIPAGGKAYLPMETGFWDYSVKVNGTVFRTKTGSTIEAGKVYKLIYEGAATVPVTSITLDQTSVDLEVGDNVTLTETVGPDNATDKTVTWSSNREDIATVVDGVVTAVGAGTAIITATANDGSGVSESCTVHVIGSAVFAKDSWSINGSGLTADNGEISITLSKTTGYFQINTNSRTGVVSSIGTATGGTENGDKMTISIIPSQEYTVKCGSYTALSGGNTWTLTLTDSGWVDEGGNVILPKNITQNITVTY